MFRCYPDSAYTIEMFVIFSDAIRAEGESLCSPSLLPGTQDMSEHHSSAPEGRQQAKQEDHLQRQRERHHGTQDGSRWTMFER